MVVALDRPVPRRSPAEHARRRAERLAGRRPFDLPERARWLARRRRAEESARDDATEEACPLR